MSFGYNDADAEILRRKAIREDLERQWIEDKQAAFDEWAEEQAKIPGSGVYRL
ncbi:hypothetical protein PBI_OAKER_69 [Mycobacterium phage Oaker]|uniref:hypothetical protein n=1 Tax=Mycobacterium phage Oaker TaxID=1445727 RepID=UPI0003E3CD54|nr:hypothetical protein CH12_gp69 [Mycobacterium phage Oaker]AHG24460.1 hypothetical protein PBI_OAKER_69 [Mycobacterium phage Oaker]AVO26047.1 hypothetical protein SEA_THUMB_70 [Mycobacterium phage Thumb]QDH84932.1 hypothetical protein SEA_Phreeze_68 [Mycobacterium phage Phreeze]QLF83953.1 hypothetical protein SEA_BECKERTON_68 [Mycobacterium phage Beckerton]